MCKLGELILMLLLRLAFRTLSRVVRDMGTEIARTYTIDGRLQFITAKHCSGKTRSGPFKTHRKGELPFGEPSPPNAHRYAGSGVISRLGIRDSQNTVQVANRVREDA